jgi:hypothetical protein
VGRSTLAVRFKEGEEEKVRDFVLLLVDDLEGKK